MSARLPSSRASARPSTNRLNVCLPANLAGDRLLTNPPSALSTNLPTSAQMAPSPLRPTV